MFENVVGQEQTLNLLKCGFARQRIPHAMLFYGPRFTGKLTTALECVRVLTCQYEGSLQCSCSDCIQQQAFLHPYTIFLGNRYFESEISLASQVLIKCPEEKFFLFFVMALRKLLRRFESFLWNDDDARYRKAYPLVVQLREKLSSFFGFVENGEMLDEKVYEQLLELVKLSKMLSRVIKDYTVSVQQIRNLRQWCLDTSWTTRIVIIEEVDRMSEASEASCNALLKLLEEPLNGLYFILLATSKTSILPTVLSRLCTYTFTEHSISDLQVIGQRIYGQQDNFIQFYPRLEYLFANITVQELEVVVSDFYFGMQKGKNFSNVYPSDLVENHFELFLFAFSCLIASFWREGKISTRLAGRQMHCLNLVKLRFLRYRQNPQSLLENFFLTFLDAGF